MQLLGPVVELTTFPEDRPPTRGEILAGVEGKQMLLCMLCDPIDGEVMDRSPDLALISNCAVGFNNIDVAAATERGIPVTNVPGVLTHATADLAWALILGVARRVAEGDRYVREGRWTGWGPLVMVGSGVHGKTLGVIGAGRIGAEVLRRAKGFGMKLLYHNRRRRPGIEEELGAEYAPLDDLLGESDFVSIHTPLTPETHGMMDGEKIGMMKPTAFLVNTSRGEVVDEDALIAALKEKRIAGAGLDVFVGEPEVDPRFMELDNALILPHVGSGTLKSRTDMGVLAVRNVAAVVQGERPENLVNAEMWDRRRKLV